MKKLKYFLNKPVAIMLNTVESTVMLGDELEGSQGSHDIHAKLVGTVIDFDDSFVYLGELYESELQEPTTAVNINSISVLTTDEEVINYVLNSDVEFTETPEENELN